MQVIANRMVFRVHIHKTCIHIRFLHKLREAPLFFGLYGFNLLHLLIERDVALSDFNFNATLVLFYLDLTNVLLLVGMGLSLIIV